MIGLAGESVHLRGLALASPVDSTSRGSQVSFLHDQGYPIVQALKARGVIADYREPGILRFGIAPLYMRYVDVFDTIDHLARVLENDEWTAPAYSQRAVVT
jgi:kynureninase